VARRYPSVVISGRKLDDIARRLAGIPLWHVFGNHGFESQVRNGTPHEQTRAWVARLTEALAGHDGIVVEDKGHTVTVHYRMARNRRHAADLIAQAVYGLPGARIIEGTEAINLLPFGGADKGVALQDALRLFACDTAIYFGDDATDEDAFGAADPDQVMGIRVGAARGSKARFHVPSQLAVDQLLQVLADLRAD
jgi:trehalose 6-phosphate phosphatase